MVVALLYDLSDSESVTQFLCQVDDYHPFLWLTNSRNGNPVELLFIPLAYLALSLLPSRVVWNIFQKWWAHLYKQYGGLHSDAESGRPSCLFWLSLRQACSRHFTQKTEMLESLKRRLSFLLKHIKSNVFQGLLGG